MSKCNKKIIQKKAFTLAEVLITLGIIGVVAAMTIPTLVGNAQDKENRTAFKKAYTNISQVVQQVAFENGGSIDGQFGTTNDTLKNFFEPYFKNVKTCNNGDSSCWTCNDARADDFFYNGNSLTGTSGWWYKNRPVIVLADGMMMNFAYISSTCQGTDAGLIAPYAGTICSAIFVDTNGCKAPNTWGRDIFNIYIQRNKSFPRGPSNDSLSTAGCSKTAGTYSGQQCAEYVIQNKDY